MYDPTSWVIREGTNLQKYTKSSETTTSVVLVNTPDAITVAGTPFSVDNMNKIEGGILDAQLAPFYPTHTAVSLSGNYNINSSDYYSCYYVSGGSVSSTIVLPDITDGRARIVKIYLVAASSNRVYIQPEGSLSETLTTDGLSTLELCLAEDFIELQFVPSLNKWLFISSNISAAFEVDTYAGYGSTDNKIMRFVNLIKNRGENVFYTQNHSSGYSSNTTGLAITILKSGWYIVTGQAQSNGQSGVAGLSINSTQLTTTISTISKDNRLAVNIGVVNGTSICTREEYFNAGDIIRMHTNGVASDLTALCKFMLRYIK